MWGFKRRERQIKVSNLLPVLKPSTVDSRARGIICEYEGVVTQIPYLVSCRDKGGKAVEFRIFAFQPSRLQFASVLDLDSSRDACNVALCLAEVVHRWGFKRFDSEPRFWFWASLLASCVKVMVEEKKKCDTDPTHWV